MMESTLTMAAESMHGILSGSDKPFRGVSTDTRTIGDGQLFVALQGPNFDGSRFVDAAAARHAVAAVVAKPVESSLPSIQVADTRIALGQLATTWRSQLSAKIVAITGSNGKTTLKEMTASCLSQAAKTFATKGNLNNDIGLPLSLLELSEDDKYAVIEMGANHAGEIEYLSSLAQPSVVAITNAAAAHLEGFGSEEGVAVAKGEILNSTPESEFAILNADDKFFDYWCEQLGKTRLISFGLDNDATVTASEIQVTADGSSFQLQLPESTEFVEIAFAGRHNVANACAAAAISLAFGLSSEQIVSGLQLVRPIGGRLKPVAGIRGAKIYDDSYNANPASVIAATQFLAAQEGSTILVLGDMGELGEQAVDLHRAVGASAKEAGIQHLLTTGDLTQHAVEAFGEGAIWCTDTDEITKELARLVRPDSSVLVKGSRSMRMGRVVRALQASDEAKES